MYPQIHVSKFVCPRAFTVLLLNGISCFVCTQDYTNKRLHAVRIRVLPRGSVKFEVREGWGEKKEGKEGERAGERREKRGEGDERKGVLEGKGGERKIVLVAILQVY